MMDGDSAAAAAAAAAAVPGTAQCQQSSQWPREHCSAMFSVGDFQLITVYWLDNLSVTTTRRVDAEQWALLLLL